MNNPDEKWIWKDREVRFYATMKNLRDRFWSIYEYGTMPDGSDRLMASHIPTASWAENLVEHMNSLEEMPEVSFLRKSNEV